MTTKHIVVSGNPIDGLTITGPFESHDKAQDWAEFVLDCDWWIAEMEDPDEQANNTRPVPRADA